MPDHVPQPSRRTTDPTRGRSAGTVENAERDPVRGRSAGTPLNAEMDPTRSHARRRMPEGRTPDPEDRAPDERAG